jgi:hypothetical protein
VRAYEGVCIPGISDEFIVLGISLYDKGVGFTMLSGIYQDIFLDFVKNVVGECIRISRSF